MKKIILLLLLILTVSFDSSKEEAYDVGEWFKFRIHYGFVNAGYATLEVKDATVHNKKVFHVVGKGYTTGVSRFFFKVADVYESYIDKNTGNPYQFVRNINEGGYTKNQEGFFNQSSNRITVKDYKRKTEKTFVIPDNTQDILSTFYYLRNHPSIDKIKPGEYIAIDMFFDDETTKFKLKFMGRENITTKFGVVSTMIFRPLVQSGRVFKEKESLTVWVSDDENKLPIRIKADLAVGSLKADLDAFKGLKAPFKIKK
ncbi:MAG: ATP-dependent exonuclease [Flavobacteriales bacterium 32-34-25]|nr:MAG: ATP-dependent exonuclease [Flavobacteriales bacterium 32-34-25]